MRKHHGRVKYNRKAAILSDPHEQDGIRCLSHALIAIAENMVRREGRALPRLGVSRKAQKLIP